MGAWEFACTHAISAITDLTSHRRSFASDKLARTPKIGRDRRSTSVRAKRVSFPSRDRLHYSELARARAFKRRVDARAIGGTNGNAHRRSGEQGELDWCLAETPRGRRTHLSRLRLYRPRQHLYRRGRHEGALRLVVDPEGHGAVSVLRRLHAVHVHRRTAGDPLRRQARGRRRSARLVDLYAPDAAGVRPFRSRH